MPVGLWLSESAIAELGDESPSCISATKAFGDWLTDRGLDPFTFNGFPLGNFHQEIVKHDVYLPTWASTQRLEYTKKLAVVQSMLLRQAGQQPTFQTISTLPLGWPPVPKESLFEQGQEFLRQCAGNLHRLVAFLVNLKRESGNHVMVCIEPEPGCVFDTCHDIVRFFREYLFDCPADLVDQTMDHIGICHDVCHSAVMFEDQEVAVSAYKEAGIRIGKVQVSSAIKVNFDESGSDQTKLQQLAQFSEPRYLHQTSIRNRGESAFFEDLNLALQAEPDPAGQWRVHFHVPIFAERLGEIETTQSDIVAFMGSVKKHQLDIPHFEVETYAWNVLPEAHQGVANDLASGIAEEMNWFRQFCCG